MLNIYIVGKINTSTNIHGWVGVAWGGIEMKGSNWRSGCGLVYMSLDAAYVLGSSWRDFEMIYTWKKHESKTL